VLGCAEARSMIALAVPAATRKSRRKPLESLKTDSEMAGLDHRGRGVMGVLPILPNRSGARLARRALAR
jgi:hypothetical protein